MGERMRRDGSEGVGDRLASCVCGGEWWGCLGAEPPLTPCRGPVHKLFILVLIVDLLCFVSRQSRLLKRLGLILDFILEKTKKV